jgi:hypothetical protein
VCVCKCVCACVCVCKCVCACVCVCKCVCVKGRKMRGRVISGFRACLRVCVYAWLSEERVCVSACMSPRHPPLPLLRCNDVCAKLNPTICDD